MLAAWDCIQVSIWWNWQKTKQIIHWSLWDFFGNYTKYSVDDFGMDVCEDEDDGLGEVMKAPDEEDHIETEKEDKAKLADAVRAEEEAGLEPERPQAQENVVDDLDGQDQMGPALHLCGGVEEALSNKPIIVKFCVGNAGAKHHGDQLSGNAHYDHSIHDTDNMYSLFSSRLEWKVARRWAKLWGPGSNVLMELMSIDGVISTWTCLLFALAD